MKVIVTPETRLEKLDSLLIVVKGDESSYSIEANQAFRTIGTFVIRATEPSTVVICEYNPNKQESEPNISEADLLLARVKYDLKDTPLSKSIDMYPIGGFNNLTEAMVASVPLLGQPLHEQPTDIASVTQPSLGILSDKAHHSANRPKLIAELVMPEYKGRVESLVTPLPEPTQDLFDEEYRITTKTMNAMRDVRPGDLRHIVGQQRYLDSI